MKAEIIQGSVFDVLPTLKPGSVDCVVTSPPYFQLRSYLPSGHPLKPLELGSEKTPAEFVDTLVRVFRLVRTAMADHAVCWLNIGDSYASSGKPGSSSGLDEYARRVRGQQDNGHKCGKRVLGPAPTPEGVKTGNLCLIPQRLAIALQADGWIVRSVIVWHKPAPMPASLSGWAWRRCRAKVANGWTKETHPSRSGVSGDISHSGGVATGKRDGVAQWADCPGCPRCSPNDGLVLRKGSWRPTSSWEPILMLAKSADYYADGEAVKTPASAATVSRDQYSRLIDDPDEQFAVRHDHETVCDGGANLRDVWTISSEALKEKHYASFPTELVHRCLKAGTSSKGYCVKCGSPWARAMTHPSGGTTGSNWIDPDHAAERGCSETPNNPGANYDSYQRSKTLGWRPSCNCSAGVRPGLVLDPFAGSSRVGIEAIRLGLNFTGVELNPEYVKMSRRILYNECPLFDTVNVSAVEAEEKGATT